MVSRDEPGRLAVTMKILCIADHVDPLVYSAAVKERFHDIDLVLSAGDLPMEYLGFLASSLNRHIGFVFGNHNLRELPTFLRGETSPLQALTLDAETRNYFGSTCLENRIRNMEGLLIAGLGGSRRYNDGLHQFSEGEMRWRIARLIPRLLWNRIRYGRYLDILLTHAPPRHVQDREDVCHQGFMAFRWFISRFRPRYLIHGHIHLYDINEPRSTYFLNTEVINAYDHLVLEITPTGKASV